MDGELRLYCTCTAQPDQHHEEDRNDLCVFLLSFSLEVVLVHSVPSHLRLIDFEKVGVIRQ